MRQRVKKPSAPKSPLDPALQRILEEVGPERYAAATAHAFAPGGQFNRERRPRYAKM